MISRDDLRAIALFESLDDELLDRILDRQRELVHEADQIIVMDAGRIVEQGTHDQLLHQTGPYTDLWRVQAGLLSNEALSL